MNIGKPKYRHIRTAILSSRPYVPILLHRVTIESINNEVWNSINSMDIW